MPCIFTGAPTRPLASISSRSISFGSRLVQGHAVRLAADVLPGVAAHPDRVRRLLAVASDLPLPLEPFEVVARFLLAEGEVPDRCAARSPGAQRPERDELLSTCTSSPPRLQSPHEVLRQRVAERAVRQHAGRNRRRCRRTPAGCPSGTSPRSAGTPGGSGAGRVISSSNPSSPTNRTLPSNGNSHLVRVQDVEQDDLVPAEAQVPQPLERSAPRRRSSRRSGTPARGG